MRRTATSIGLPARPDSARAGSEMGGGRHTTSHAESEPPLPHSPSTPLMRSFLVSRRRRLSLGRCLRPGDFRSCVAVGTKHLVGLFLWLRGSVKIWIDVLPEHSAL